MTTELYKGQTKTVSAKFVRSGVAVQFQGSPTWLLYNSKDQVVLNGTAVQGNGTGEWLVNLTIPDTYELTDGLRTESMLLEVFGEDSTYKSRSTEFPIDLIDYADDYLPEGVIYYTGQELVDVLNVESRLAAVAASIQNAAGEVLPVTLTPTIVTTEKVRPAGDVPDRFTPISNTTRYHVTVNLGTFVLPESVAPYLIYYTLTKIDGTTETVIHQLFWTNNRTLNIIMGMRNYLDKARLEEIDPTLQWNDPELAECTYHGMDYVNSHPPELTYWRASDLPQSMQTYWLYASALHALNTRYIAEGMTQFDFTGLNTTLNVDRKEVLTYKMEELKNFLEKLNEIKKAAIRAEGKGEADPTANANAGRAHLAHIALTLNPTNNAFQLRSYDRLRRFRQYRR